MIPSPRGQKEKFIHKIIHENLKANKHGRYNNFVGGFKSLQLRFNRIKQYSRKAHIIRRSGCSVYKSKLYKISLNYPFFIKIYPRNYPREVGGQKALQPLRVRNKSTDGSSHSFPSAFHIHRVLVDLLHSVHSSPSVFGLHLLLCKSELHHIRCEEVPEFV